MKKIVKGLIIGNDKKEAIIETLKQLMSFTDTVEITRFRKIKSKDMFEYECNIDI